MSCHSQACACHQHRQLSERDDVVKKSARMNPTQRTPSYLGATDYRQFLRALVEDREPGQSGRSFGALALRCGFRSRSFLRDVVQGQRRLTPASHAKVLAGLPLPAKDLRLFDYLVQREESEVRPPRTPLTTVEKRLEAARARARAAYELSDSTDFRRQVLDLVGNPLFPRIYASLGDATKGESLAGICRKLQQPPSTVGPVLAAMTTCGLARKALGEENFVAVSSHFIIESVGASDAFRTIFLASLEAARRSFNENPASTVNLFETTTFSLPADRVPTLKRELRRVLNEFVEAHEAPDGGALCTLTVAALMSGERSVT